MTRPAKYTKSQLAKRLETVFKENGYEGASMKMLSEATGLSKASLYHHFPKGKDEMAAYVLAQSGARLQTLVLSPLAQEAPKSGVQKLLASFQGTANYYDGAPPFCLMNSLLLGSGLDLFSSRIGAAVEMWRKGLSSCLVEAGASRQDANDWADDVLGRIQGALVLCRVSGQRLPLETCLRGLEEDVETWGAAS
ncbi:MAG: TetR/AcrR family transcriptional regulator [Alphaproteobacteria bacterium]|nr:TetR/AcrR family transcriptional regulator [Alphaproteobacteria bacterium]